MPWDVTIPSYKKDLYARLFAKFQESGKSIIKENIQHEKTADGSCEPHPLLLLLYGRNRIIILI